MKITNFHLINIQDLNLKHRRKHFSVSTKTSKGHQLCFWKSKPVRAHVWMHHGMYQPAIVLVRCEPECSLLPPPYWKARSPWRRGCFTTDMTSKWVSLHSRPTLEFNLMHATASNTIVTKVSPRGRRFKKTKKLFNKFIAFPFEACSERIIDFRFLSACKILRETILAAILFCWIGCYSLGTEKW